MLQRSDVSTSNAVLLACIVACATGVSAVACEGDPSHGGSAGDSGVHPASTGSASPAPPGALSDSDAATPTCADADCSDAAVDGALGASAQPAVACGGSPSTQQCASTVVPATLQATVSGFETCTCFNGTFTLTRGDDGEWASPPITGCPGQSDAAYVKLAAVPTESGGTAFQFGITNQANTPGSGNPSWCAGTSTVDCAPFQASGRSSATGNIASFCTGPGEVYDTRWTITP